MFLLAGERLKNFRIGTTNTSPKRLKPTPQNYHTCAAKNGTMSSAQYEVFKCVAEGRYVIIQLKGKDFLTLCEVEVFYGR